MNISTKTVALFAAVGFVVAGAIRAHAQDTNAPTRPEFSTFKLVTDRNIFNTRRRPGRTAAPVDNRRTLRYEYAALAGTMSYEKGTFAFFDGSSSEYTKSLKPSDKIAGFTITTIEPSSVKLESGTNKLVLPVGMQLRREAGGEWLVAERSDTQSRTRSDTRSRYRRGFNGVQGTNDTVTTADSMDDTLVLPDGTDAQADPGPDAAPAPADAGTTDPVLLRLMQRRAREGNP
jgi:hypothetical protein